jgi:tetratricopeptide (TPR) repeat protein
MNVKVCFFLIVLSVYAPSRAAQNESPKSLAHASSQPALSRELPLVYASSASENSMRDSTADLYKIFAEHVDQEAKQAIASSTASLDVAKWVVLVIGSIIAIAGWSGIKSASDMKKELKEFQSEIRAELKELQVNWQAKADASVSTLVLQGETKIQNTVLEWETKISERMFTLKSANFLAHFIVIAQAHKIRGETISIGLGFSRNDAERANLEMHRADAFEQLKGNLRSALAYVDDASEEMAKDLVSQVIWALKPKTSDLPPKLVLKSWIYLVLAWVAKREGNISEAIRSATKSYDIFPEDPDTVYNLACYYSLSKNGEKSLDFLEEALIKNPKFSLNVWKDSDFAFLRKEYPDQFIRVVGPDRAELKPQGGNAL